MSHNRTIRYAVDLDGIVISRVGSEIAHPVLDYEAIGQNGDFQGPMNYYLERMNVLSIHPSTWRTWKWTKKIPQRLKNKHRKFWGMKPLS